MSTRPSSAWRRTLAVGLLGLGVANAQQEPNQVATHDRPAQRVSLQHAISLGAKHGPRVRRASAAQPAARMMADVSSPALSQLPYIQAQLGPRRSRGALSPEVIVEVTQPFALWSTGSIQRGIARATRAAVASELENAELDDAERAAHAWVELALAEVVLRLRQEFLTATQVLNDLARARLEAGDAEPVDAALASSELAEARSMAVDAEGERLDAQLTLSHSLGLAPNEQVGVDGSLPAPPPYELQSDRSAMPAATHPAVVAAERRAELALSEVEQSKLQQAPTVAFGVQYQREGTGDQVLTAVATVPLPVARPWEFQQSQKYVEVERARAEARYVRAETALELARARREVERARGQFALLSDSALPSLREAHRLALLRYTHGATDFVQVSMLRQRLLRMEEQAAAALADVHHAHLRFLAASGTLHEAGSR